jgi:hypothetical protein
MGYYLQERTGAENYLDGSGDSREWYSHVEDCKIVSALYPNVAFRISGDGLRTAFPCALNHGAY